ncbi:MAG: ABC-2 family transporter protein [Gammaproteobacteria bacterium]|nr:ABC-2 family transporter protein [Gammaproteobacteria bacterium]
MKTAITLFGRYLGISVRSQMQYRGSFVLYAIGQFFTTGVEVLGIWALFDRFGTLGVWTLAHVAVFYGSVNMAFAVADTFSRGFDSFGSAMVKTGDFDRILLRPRSTVFQIAGQDFPLHRIGRFLQGALVFVYGVVVLELDWSAFQFCLLFLAFVGMFFFFYGLMIFQATLSFWSTESLEVMNVFVYGGVEACQYPLSIYRDWFRSFFTYVIPLGCVAYFPIVGVLGVDDPLGSGRVFQMLAPLAGIAFFSLSLYCWNFGVRHYTSTGS